MQASEGAAKSDGSCSIFAAADADGWRVECADPGSVSVRAQEGAQSSDELSGVSASARLLEPSVRMERAFII